MTLHEAMVEVLRNRGGGWMDRDELGRLPAATSFAARATPAETLVTAGLEPQPLADDRSQGPLALPEGGALVRLCDPDGSPLSNRVPLDEPARLRGWLEEHTPGADRPRELEASDYDTPVGRLLLYLHERCIFDI